MFERPAQGERALLIQVSHPIALGSADLAEFIALAESAGAEVLDSQHVVIRKINARLLIGTGKAEEFAEFVAAQEIELVIVNAALSPSQERNLEKLFQCRVLDRTGLILDIFAQRARSHEGKLQVELAQLRHLSTRLVRGWTHLERQKGGIGLRGPGETQLETDRRLLADRIKQISKRLEKVSAQRDLVRIQRKKRTIPTVAVVGYTNAGKSTLFNVLTGASVYAEDQLFATLDTTLRKLQHLGSETVLLTDTVGFVSRLPHELVAAFKSTLQETVEADLLLHVIDAADPEHLVREQDVNNILKEIGAQDVPVIRIYNKIDLTDQSPSILEPNGQVEAVFLSAQAMLGTDTLVNVLIQYFYGDQCRLCLQLPPQAGQLRALLYAGENVIREHYDEEGHVLLDLALKQSTYEQLKTRFHDVWFEKISN